MAPAVSQAKNFIMDTILLHHELQVSKGNSSNIRVWSWHGRMHSAGIQGMVVVTLMGLVTSENVTAMGRLVSSNK